MEKRVRLGFRAVFFVDQPSLRVFRWICVLKVVVGWVSTRAQLGTVGYFGQKEADGAQPNCTPRVGGFCLSEVGWIRPVSVYFAAALLDYEPTQIGGPAHFGVNHPALRGGGLIGKFLIPRPPVQAGKSVASYW